MFPEPTSLTRTKICNTLFRSHSLLFSFVRGVLEPSRARASFFLICIVANVVLGVIHVRLCDQYGNGIQRSTPVSARQGVYIDLPIYSVLPQRCAKPSKSN